jgi:RNA-dependent RNA polymerase
LEEGQVFCQWQDPDDVASEPQVVEGHVMMCRAPAMHMGDIRRVRAVDHVRLRHLVNVIVFNVRGARDLPNMLGGGDLDGDDYTLIWDSRLLIRENSPPMDYTAPKPIRVPRVTMTDVCENFVNYLKNDMLGQIANAHLAWTDIRGPASATCVELARLHSVAVDFAKTGVPADMSSDLRPEKWPDFMGKPEKAYVSEKILGKLFRLVEEPAFREVQQADVERGIDVILGQVRVPTEILVIVAKVKAVYDMEIWALLLRYRLAEAEAFCGVILHNAGRSKTKDHDLKDPVSDAFRAIVAETKHELLWRYAEMFDPEETFLSSDLNCRLSAKNLIAIACYQMAYIRDYQDAMQDIMDEGRDDASDSGADNRDNSRT